MRFPIIVSIPEVMTKVRVVTVKDYLEQTLKALHRVGVLHVETSKELKPVDKTAIEDERNRLDELLTYVDDALSHVSGEERVSPEESVEVIYTRPFSQLQNEVISLCTRLGNQHLRVVKQEQEIKHLTELKTYLEPLARHADVRLRDLSFSGNYLFTRLFVLPSEAYDDLHDELKGYLFESVARRINHETVLYVIGKIENQKVAESLVSQAEGKVVPIPEEDLTLSEFLRVARDRIHQLEPELTKLSQEWQNQIRDNLEKLVLMKSALLAESERISVLEKASETKYAVLIEGWIPESNVEAAMAELKYELDYVFIDIRRPEVAEEPPTKQKNPVGTKPFQVITNLFSLPKYGEWDPTPVIAFSFALFFGIMTNDVVYALGIILLGKFLLSRFVDDPQSDNFKLFQRLVYICGGVSLVIGLLSGSYLGNIYELFGFENVALSSAISEIFINPLSLIVLALMMGLVHVNIGHLLALIKAVKQKDKPTIMNKIGLFVLQLGIPSIVHFVLRVNIPLMTPQIYTILSYFMLAGIVLVFLAFMLQRGGLGILLGFLDILGLFGDVMSYARLAGVGLATYYLAVVFNMMSGVFSTLFSDIIGGIAGAIIGSVVGILLLVLGHLVNTVLSGIASFVHSLRLCFVEFLFKFYEGGGREYNPFRLKTRIPVTVTVKS